MFYKNQVQVALPNTEAIKAIKDKYNSKTKLYQWMTGPCKWQFLLKKILINLINIGNKYLPPFEDCTVAHMFEVIAGRKKALSVTDLKPMAVPRFSEFSLKHIMPEI